MDSVRAIHVGAMNTNKSTMIVLEVTVWDQTKVDALVTKIEHDARVMNVRVLA